MWPVNVVSGILDLLTAYPTQRRLLRRCLSHRGVVCHVVSIRMACRIRGLEVDYTVYVCWRSHRRRSGSSRHVE